MKKLQHIHKWKHDPSANKWSSLYADTTPKQGTLPSLLQNCADGELGVANKSTTSNADKDLQREIQELNEV